MKTMTSLFIKVPSLLAIVCLTAFIAAGQDDSNPVLWSVKLEPAQLRPGDTAKLLATAKIAPGWQIYGLTRVKAVRATRIIPYWNGILWLNGDAEQPTPKMIVDSDMTLESGVFENEATFSVPVRLATKTPPGVRKAYTEIRYWTRHDNQSIPERTNNLVTDVTVLEEGPASSPDGSVALSLTTNISNSLIVSNSKFRSEAGGFAVSFPGTVDKSKRRTRDGLIMTTFRSAATNKSWAGMVSTGFADPREAANTDKWFRELIGGLEETGAQVSNRRPTTFLGRTAMKFDVTLDDVTGTGYVILDDDRFFSIFGIAKREKDHSMIEPFLNSLEILER